MADDKEEPQAEAQAEAQAEGGDDLHELTPGYKAPKKVDLDTIKQLDSNDESLVKYKAQLLGQTEKVLDEGGNNVIVQKLILVPEGHAETALDLTGELTQFKKAPIIMKEGVNYRVKIQFRVQRDIVSGLRYVQTTYRKGIRVDKTMFMVGSYGPKTEPHIFQTPIDEAPSGLVSRGHYTIKSLFTDDDKNVYLEWEWALDIKKEWE
eukprot:Em0020g1010a